MKIGILTLPLHFNYGGILQAYALQTILERMGHNVVILDKSRYKHVNWLRIIKELPRNAYTIFVKKDKTKYLLGAYSYNKTKRVIASNTQRFIDNHIKQIHFNNFSELKENDFDCIIVGSDQIWRPKFAKYLQISSFDSFLGFAKDWKKLKRIAYAPSFGSSAWEISASETDEIRKIIGLFLGISVREEDGIDLIRQKLGRNDVVHVLDPTMLLNKADYMFLISNNTSNNRGDMLCYVLDTGEIIDSLIQNIAKQMGLTPFHVGAQTNNTNLPLKKRIQPPLEDWLQGFNNAKLIITDSFHACVFSILFKKPFFVVCNKRRGMSRFESLLGQFGLENRMINSDNMSKIDLTESIDYEIVYSILEKRKQYSIEFLKKYLTI